MGGREAFEDGTIAICAKPNEGGEEGEVVMMGAAGASIPEVVGVGGSEFAVGGGVREVLLVGIAALGDSIAGSGGCSATGDGIFILALLGCILEPGRVGATAKGEANGLDLSLRPVGVGAGDRDSGLRVAMGEP